MNKLELAHEWAKLIGPETNLPLDILVDNCFDYAEAMLAEDEKRKDKSLPEALQDEFVIDWSLSPKWANWWAMDLNKSCFWFANKPEIINEEEFFDDGNGSKHIIAPSLNYQGDWKQSLRKRPE